LNYPPYLYVVLKDYVISYQVIQLLIKIQEPKKNPPNIQLKPLYPFSEENTEAYIAHANQTIKKIKKSIKRKLIALYFRSSVYHFIFLKFASPIVKEVSEGIS
tara:strand:+ start:259 stop:567 length:309 start_codon:yes stop_codon:yes gene_type:complete